MNARSGSTGAGWLTTRVGRAGLGIETGPVSLGLVFEFEFDIGLEVGLTPHRPNTQPPTFLLMLPPAGGASVE